MERKIIEKSINISGEQILPQIWKIENNHNSGEQKYGATVPENGEKKEIEKPINISGEQKYQVKERKIENGHNCGEWKYGATVAVKRLGQEKFQPKF